MGVNSDSGESSKRKAESYRETSIILENTFIIMNRILLERWSSRYQKEMKNMLLATGEKTNFGYKMAEDLF